ncbi:hypothetical protein WP12_15130 [Sphingomonas sp. SRS2]|nr:hypothetical protein WP12_15130 [Sphingomonas sp. SRS2]
MLSGTPDITDIDVGTIPRVALRARTRFGAEFALVEGTRSWTFAEYVDAALAVAAGLICAGVQRGDRVATWAPNTAEHAIVTLGIHCAGAVLVPLNTRFKGREAADLLRRSGAQILFTVETFLGIRFGDMLQAARAEDAACLPLPPRMVPIEPDSDGWHAFLAAGAADRIKAERRAEDVAPDDIATIIFTSGTTGRPKGVMLSHVALVTGYWQWSSRTGMQHGDKCLASNPFCHVMGLKAGLLSALEHGATIYPMALFDPGHVLDLIEAEGITYLTGPPAIFQMLLGTRDLEQRKLDSLRGAVVGGSNISRQLITDMFGRLGLAQVATCYGLTESCALVTATRAEDSVEIIAGTSGSPLPHVKLEIRDSEGVAMSSGETGEIMVRSPYHMKGYLDDAAATGEAIDAAGWLATGDLGAIDPAGNLVVRGRKKEMLIVGGFNVYAAEVEAALLEHPDIRLAAVIGVPDARLGEVPKAFVVPVDAVVLDPAAVLQWIGSRIANYKAPRFIEIRASLPLNSTGKVMKMELERQDRAL